MQTDITAVYYTANVISAHFAQNTRRILSEALGDIPLIEVPLPDGWTPSHLNIYRQALMGAKQATTEYIALCEDDVLYTSEHFAFRPSPGKFGYNKSCWAIYTWVKPPIFSYKDRVNLHQLICERELFIEAMEERFARWPGDTAPINSWGEPGKNPAYEKNLGVTIRETQNFFSKTPNVAFSHEHALSFAGLGTRKKLGDLRVTALPKWGTAEEVRKLYV